eukprot:3197276-Pyramimonas_sp.AAC.1
MLQAETRAGTTVAYTTLMTAFLKAGRCEAAVQVYAKMRAAGVEPNLYTYNVLIAAYQGGQQWDEADNLLQEMRQS